MFVEGLGSVLEECPDINMYLGKHSSSEKAVPFWHVKPIEKEEDANMELIKVSVSVWASAGIKRGLEQPECWHHACFLHKP